MSGSRKLLFGVLVVLIAGFLCYVGKMADGVAAQLMGAALVAVTAGNVISKFSPESKVYAEGVVAEGKAAEPGVQP